MKSTGIIRRIDDLGRIVIPKEIRKNLRIKNGENLEIFVNEEENIILRKYNQIDKLKDLALDLKESIHNIAKKDIFITNTESIIASSKKEYNNKELSTELINIIYGRKEILKENTNIEIIKNKKETISYTITPIIANGDVLGSVIISGNKITDNDLEISKITSNFLARYIEG